jgi:hypothetical protein
VGGSPAQRLEQVEVEYGSITGEAGDVLEMALPFAGNLDNEPSGPPPRKGDPDDRADVGRPLQPLRYRVPETVVNGEGRDAGDDAGCDWDQSPATSLISSTLSSRSQANPGRPKCP